MHRKRKIGRMHRLLILLATVILPFYKILFSQSGQPAGLSSSDKHFFGVLYCSDPFTETYHGISTQSVAKLIDELQPDFMIVDCKGHRGLSNYPTRVGYTVPEPNAEAMRIFRQVTAEKGVSLYCYYSGILDEEAVRRHPEWAVQSAEGRLGGLDGRATSVFGPYVDALMIPQLLEIADWYDVDGFWIDGECWALERDYQPQVIEEFQQTVGSAQLPRKPKDPHWYEFSQFCREGFRRYLAHYVDALHRHKPRLQIASNWAYSSFMPEAVEVAVDYLSGDIIPENAVNTARLESRILAQQNKQWNLMAWSYTMNWDDPEGFQSPKSAVQLQQEAAIVLAQGGGFQVFFSQNSDSLIKFFDTSVIAQVARFCRSRQAYCHKAFPIPQIGLILSTDAYYRKLDKLFHAARGELNPFKGILKMLLESQLVVDVVMEHTLTQNIERYPLLIYPEWETITPAFKQQLIRYIENGGSLLIIGPSACRLFQSELAVQWADSLSERINYLAVDYKIASIKSLSRVVRLQDNIKPFGEIFADRQGSVYYAPAASICRLGKGRIAGIYLNLGERYLNGKTAVARYFLAKLVHELFPSRLVTVEGSSFVDVSPSRLDDKLLIHLVNTTGPHDTPNVYVYDEIQPVGPLTVTVRLAQKPQSVSIQPSQQKLKSRFHNGILKIIVPKLELYEIIVVAK